MYKIIEKVTMPSGIVKVSIEEESPNYSFFTRTVKKDISELDDDNLIDYMIQVISEEFNPNQVIRDIKQDIEIFKNEIEIQNNAILSQKEDYNLLKNEITNIVNEKIDKITHVLLHSEMSDEAKESLVSAFDKWEGGVEYDAGKVVNYNGELYKVVQKHKSQSHYYPSIETASLYTKYLNPVIVDEESGEVTEVVNEYVQPTGAHDAYKKGDKVMFEGSIYESQADANVYSPSAFPRNWVKL